MPKAVQIYEIGGTEVLKLEEVDLPKKGASEVLIKTRSIGVVGRACALLRMTQSTFSQPSRLDAAELCARRC
jgi:NADPH:quinone reductase-like Zn-dependent oxidoreductase